MISVKPHSRSADAGKLARAALQVHRPGTIAVKKLRQALGLNRRQFARLAAASERAVADWENDRPISPIVQKSLRESERLCRALMKVMKPEHVGTWLDTPNDAFSGLKPLDLIERGEVDRLWRMVFEVKSGALS
jgi:transcriptional regulator with XRE-family HTH domain